MVLEENNICVDNIMSFLTVLVFILAFFRAITAPRGRPKIGLKSQSLKRHLLAEKQPSVSMEDYEDIAAKCF